MVQVASNIPWEQTVCRNLIVTRFCIKRRNVELVWYSIRRAVESHVSGHKASREQGRLVLGQYSDWHLNADAFTLWHLISYSKGLFEECGKLGFFCLNLHWPRVCHFVVNNDHPEFPTKVITVIRRYFLNIFEIKTEKEKHKSIVLVLITKFKDMKYKASYSFFCLKPRK